MCESEPFDGQVKLQMQCPPLKMITLGQHKSENNNQIIQLMDVFFVLLELNEAQ